jgi:uncharacterized protein YjiS (DUF1127 family)
MSYLTTLARLAPGLPAQGPIGLPKLNAARVPGTPRRPSLWAMLRAAWRRHRTRRCLAELDARTLKDIGVTYAEAEAEANKPFWIL